MLTVKTTRFGELEVKDPDVLTMPLGLIGFPELKSFVMLDHDKDSPFKWLQSLDDGAIAFVLINPLLFKPEYTVEVTSAEVSDLGLESEDDAVISVIITMPTNPQNMTANLKAPLVFNLKNRRGKQIILNSSAYTTRHNIMEEIRRHTEQQKQKHAQETIEETRQREAAAAAAAKVQITAKVGTTDQ